MYIRSQDRSNLYDLDMFYVGKGYEVIGFDKTLPSEGYVLGKYNNIEEANSVLDMIVTNICLAEICRINRIIEPIAYGYASYMVLDMPQSGGE